MRPVLLTTETTVGGLLPLGLFGGSMWAPMAFAIIGGLIVSSVLTLVVVPLIFRLVAARRAIQLVGLELINLIPPGSSGKLIMHLGYVLLLGGPSVWTCEGFNAMAVTT